MKKPRTKKKTAPRRTISVDPSLWQPLRRIATMANTDARVVVNVLLASRLIHFER
jgi:hypothetical protein